MKAFVRRSAALFSLLLTPTSCSSSGDSLADVTNGSPGAGGASGSGTGDATGSGGKAGGGTSAAGGASSSAGGSSTAGAAGLGAAAGGSTSSGGMAGKASGATGGTSSSAGSAGAGGSEATGATGGAAACNFVPLPCTPEQHAAQVAIMNAQPIIPPRFLGGIDFAGGPTWGGTTFAKIAEGFYREDYATAAQAVPGGCVQVCTTTPDGSPQWGGILPTGPSGAKSPGPTMFVQPPYTGALTMVSRPGGPWGAHTYVLAVGQQMLRDGAPMDIDFDAGAQADPLGWPNEIYDALVYTFVPILPPLASGQSCTVTQDCQVALGGPGNFFWAGSVQFGWLFGHPVQGPVAARTISQFQLDGLTRDLPFTRSSVTLAIGGTGPTLHLVCTVDLGTPMSAILTNCIDTAHSPFLDAREEEKLFGALFRGTETYSFRTPGIALDVHADTLAPFDILKTDQKPADTDTIVAVRLLADGTDLTVGNDFVGEASDSHGAGLVHLEFARLVQDALQDARTDVCPDATNCPPGQAPRRVLADPACTSPNVTVDGKGNPVFAQGCTGLEGFITPASTKTTSTSDQPFLAALALGATGFATAADDAVGLAPGRHAAAFCVGLSAQKASQCDELHGGIVGGLFTTTYHRIVQAIAGGDPTAMPAGARDPVFLAKHYATAFTRYLLAVGAGTANADTVHAVQAFPEDLATTFGDNDVSFLYVARHLATASTPPPTFRISIDTANDTVDSYEIGLLMERAEAIVYQAEQTPGSVLGGDSGDDVALVSLFGSAVLRTTWGANPSCATTSGPTCSPGPPLDEAGAPALDERGNPLLARYQPMLSAKGPLELGPVAAQIESVLAATVDGSPVSYARTSLTAGGATLEALLPYAASGATSGLLLPDAGGNDVLLPADSISFRGTSLDLSVAFAAGPSATEVTVQGVTARAPEGRVFLCFDPASRTLLSAKAGDPLDELATWVTKHPAAAAACDIVQKAPALLASRANGVALRFSGAPAMRVAEVTLWDPALSP